MNGQNRHHRVSLPIFLKSTVLTASVLVATTIVLGTTWFTKASIYLKDSILSGLSGIVESKAGRLNGIIEQDFERAALVASRTRLRQCLLNLDPDRQSNGEDQQQIRRILHDARESVKAIAALQVFDRKGGLVAAAQTDNSGQPSSSATARSCIENGVPILGKIRARENELFYDVWYPLHHPDKTPPAPIGALKCRFSIERIFAVVGDRTGLGDTGEVMLARDADGGILFISPLLHSSEPPLSFFLSGNAPAAPPVLLALAGRKGTLSEAVDYRGHRILAAYAPVEAAGWGLVAKIDAREGLAPIRDLGFWSIQVSIAALIAGALAALLFSRFLTRPILELGEAARALASGNFDYRVDVRTRDETGELARVFNRMAHRIQVITASRDELNREVEERIVAESRLREAMMEVRTLNDQMMDDLRMAREIQQSLMPAGNPEIQCQASARHRAARFTHFYQPSWALGGDFFDIRPHGDNRVLALICDVMGHGLRAALVTAIIRGLLEDLPETAERAGDALTFLNEGLIRILPQQDQLVFVSACCVLICPDEQVIDCAAAGHPAPIIVSPTPVEPTSLYSEDDVGPVLGLDEEAAYPSQRHELAPEEAVVMFTDGIFEAESPDGTIFGEKRFRALIHGHVMNSGGLLATALDAAVAEVAAFTGSDEVEDDVCILGFTIVNKQQETTDAPL